MGWWSDAVYDGLIRWLSTALLSCFDAVVSLLTRILLITPDVTGLPQVTALTGRSVWVVDSVFVLAFVAAGALTMSAGGSERVPDSYRRLIARYYESLAKVKK